MATVLDALKGLNAYPIPLRELDNIAQMRGLSLESEVTGRDLAGRAFKLAKADILLWLSLAPDISQGGQSYSFTNEQRTDMRNRARALYGEFEEDEAAENKCAYGYKGSRL